MFGAQKTGVSEHFKRQNLLYSELSKNYEKMTLKSNFGNRKKLAPTQKST
jgi:hypothetical protein